MSTNNTKSECIECGSDILAEHSYCLNCGYRPVKQIISIKQNKLLAISVFIMSSIILMSMIRGVRQDNLNSLSEKISLGLYHVFLSENDEKKEIANNEQEIDQVVISDKNRDSILYDSILNNVLNSEDIIICGDKYFKINSENLKLDLNGYEVIEFKNLKFKYDTRNSENMTELDRLNGLTLEIKYNLTFDYSRNYIFRGLIYNNNKYMIEPAGWSNWSSTNGSLANGVYSAYSNKQPEWSHNKSSRDTNLKPACDEIIKKTDSNYYIEKYADQINELNLAAAKSENLIKIMRPYYGHPAIWFFRNELGRIERLCFKADTNGELNQEQIITCRNTIDILESEVIKFISEL